MAHPDNEALLRIPLIEESFTVTPQLRETGGVRVRKSVDLREEICELPLVEENLAIERVAIGRLLDGGSPPQAHYEGDTLVIPVLEEIAVVQKRLRLVEELRITRQRTEQRVTERVQLRRERAEVERIPPTEPKGDST